jgi:hypothetical protein
VSETTELLKAVLEIRDLVQLMAEPQIAARDQKLRNELIQIVGKSGQREQVVFLLDGTQTQAAIRSKSGMKSGNLSTFVKELRKAKLVTEDDAKQPKLAIAIPPDFFEKASAAK